MTVSLDVVAGERRDVHAGFDDAGLLLLATALGAALGYEREAADKPAGLRTHSMIAAASALIVIVGRLALEESPDANGDPSRALHAVITGIGFLGAGAIIRRTDSKSVEGLTTASSLFLAAAIGVTCGEGEPVLAAATVVMALVILRGFAWVGARARQRERLRVGPDG